MSGLTDHSYRLWALLVLELWQQKYLDAARADLRTLKASALMCGITGAAWTGGVAPLELGILERMTTALAHRGPDDAGYYHSRWAPAGAGRDLSARRSGTRRPAPARRGRGSGHRRLSIIDLAGGHQPLSNEDGTIWITFNGEIYNYRELQPVLERQGHRFRTSSDTETIVHLYEQHGSDCVKFLRGMFAFAIWDDRRGKMFLARDRLGKKPLVYRLGAGPAALRQRAQSTAASPRRPARTEPGRRQ